LLPGAHRRRHDVGHAVVETAGTGAADGPSVLNYFARELEVAPVISLLEAGVASATKLT